MDLILNTAAIIVMGYGIEIPMIENHKGVWGLSNVDPVSNWKNEKEILHAPHH
jgi:hypothetical protein